MTYPTNRHLVPLTCLALTLTAGLAPDASAISMRDDVALSSYETQLNTAPYSASGSLDVFLTGTLIAPNWVLTAAHVTNPTSFTASDGTTRSIVERVVYPGDPTFADQLDAGDGSDFALVRLSSAINTVPIASLHDPVASGITYADFINTNVLIGETAVYTGSGRTGDGDNGQTGGRDLLAGTNVINAVGANTPSSGFVDNLAVADFDDPNAIGPPNGVTALEMGLLEGDSGGGLWVDLGDGPVLIGVHSLGGGTYGDTLASTLITDDVYNWINSTVPEPSSLALLCLGGMLALCRRR